MAINPSVAFAGKIGPVSAEYPYGEARDVSAPGDGTGTPLQALWVNDLFGMEQHALSEAGVTPSGTPDNAEDSQIIEAVRENFTRELWRRTLAEAGFVLVGGSFQEGTADITTAAQAVWDKRGHTAYCWTGALPKAVPQDTDPSADALWIDLAPRTLRSALASNSGSALIGEKLSGASAVSQTQHEINETVYNISRWGGNLSLALDEIPAGCVLQLNNFSYLGNIDKTRSDITIRGTGMGWYNAGKTAIVGGGSRITGKLMLTGDNICVEKLSIDSGSDVCTAINSGNPMDCLAILDPTRAIRKNITVRDVITLCQAPASAAHNFLLEGLSDSFFTNLHARYGQWGIVMKTESSHLVGGNAYACSQAGFTAKSDTGVAGSPCVRSSASQIHVDNSEYPDAEQGVLIYAATFGLDDFKLTDSTVMYGKRGHKLLCDTRDGANFARKVKMSGLMAYGQSILSFESFGACSDCFVDDFVFDGCTSNNAILVDSNCLSINITNGIASVPVASPTTVNLAGRFVIDNVRSVVTSDIGTKSGINTTPESATTFSYGNNIGTLALNGVVGWTPAFTNLTVVNGTGGVTYAGSYSIIGDYIKWQAQINVTGSATTASSASSTRINNLPFAVAQNEPLFAINNVVGNGGIGLCQAGGQNAFTPTWSAYNGAVYMSGMYKFR